MGEMRVWQRGRKTLWELKKVGENYQGGSSFDRVAAIERAAMLALSFGVTLVIDDIVLDPYLVLDRIKLRRLPETEEVV